MASVPAVSVTEHMHAHKQQEDQYQEPVFSYPFHFVHLVG
jgi:hypothetical protein